MTKFIQNEPIVATVAIDHQMTITHVHVGKNSIKDVLLDGGFGVNITMKRLYVQLGLFKPKLTPYNLHMANQTIVKPLGLIKDLKIYIHGIPYIITFTIIYNGVMDSTYAMLLMRPWLKDVKIVHDWGSNVIII